MSKEWWYSKHAKAYEFGATSGELELLGEARIVSRELEAALDAHCCACLSTGNGTAKQCELCKIAEAKRLLHTPGRDF